MKLKSLLITALFTGLAAMQLMSQNASLPANYVQGPPQRTCGTPIPPDAWEQDFQNQIAAFLAQQNNPGANGKGINQQTEAVYTIPVIIHVIHGGQAVGTYPNLAQGQLNSQVQVLNDDFAGVGLNTGNYPATAYTAWATNTIVSAASKDFSGRIKIANTGITFCLATKDTLGNILPEPGIDRVNYNNITAPLGTFPSKNPAATQYSTTTTFMNFVNGYIKPNTIWNVSKYLNIWVTDENSNVGLLGYATFPPSSGLTGISGPGTATTDGFWAWARAFGSSTIFPGGFYTPTYDKGRTCTHEIGHWIGLRHIWGDGTCLTDYCNDTPPASASNFGTPTYPYKSGSCAGPPSNSPNGEMFMNFMDYTDDIAMYMFTNDQRTRIQTAMANSPYRKFLGTHGLCSVPPPTANFSISVNPLCAGQTATITDMSTGSPGAWSYTITGGSPATSTLQSLTVSYATAGVYTISMVASNGGGSSAPVVKTVTVNAIPTLTVSAPASICAGQSATISSSGATTYTLNTGATGANIVVSPTTTTNYTVTGANGSCTSTKTLQITVGSSLSLSVTPSSPSICVGSSVSLSASGATSYTWSTGTNAASISVTPSVTTTYTLNGSNGSCSGSKTVAVNVTPTPTLSMSSSSSSLCPGTSGTITALASGGAPFTYTWSTGANTSAISTSVSGVYTATTTNAGGCKASSSYTLSAAPGVTLTATAGPTAVCAGSSSTLSATGATSYTWNTGSNATSISVSPSVTTTYTVTGSNGTCAGSKTVALTVNANPTVAITPASSTLCAGNNVTLSGSGATSYTWNTGANTTSISASPSVSTTYTLTGSNTAGCTNVKTVAVTVNANPTVNISPSSATICATSSVVLAGSGATTYTWNTGANTASIPVSPTVTTTYTLTGASSGCTNSKTVAVTVNALPSISINPPTATICATSTVSLFGSGASTYTWNTGANTSSIAAAPSTSTVYTLSGSSTAGCSSSKTAAVTVNALPAVSISANPTAICPGSTSTLTASGTGPAPFTYTWSSGANTSAITSSVAGVYSATLSNGNGCANVQSYTLNSTGGITVTAVASSSAVCAGSSATLSASGASTYSWNTGATGNAIVVSPSSSATYTVNGVSGSCNGSTTVALVVNPNPVATSSATNTSCFGACDGIASVNAGSGTAPYTYSMMPGSCSGASCNNLCAGSYTFIVIDNNGCKVTSTAMVGSPSVLTSAATASNASCGTCADGTVTSSVSGGTGPYTYTWTPGGSNSANLTNALPGCYTLTVADAMNCSSTSTACVGFGSGISSSGAAFSGNIYILPNPNTGIFTVKADFDQSFDVMIYNAIGQLIKEESAVKQSKEINLSTYSKGLYNVILKVNDNYKTVKVIIE